MRKTGDYSRASTRQYERAWMRAYGHDFSYVRARMSCMSCIEGRGPGTAVTSRMGVMQVLHKDSLIQQCCHPMKSQHVAFTLAQAQFL